VDLTSPDDAARRDDDDATREREPRGDATPRDGPDKTSALFGIKGVKTNVERAESPVVSIAISDSEDGEDAETRMTRRGNADAATETTSPSSPTSPTSPTSPRRGARAKTRAHLRGFPLGRPRSHARARRNSSANSRSTV